MEESLTSPEQIQPMPFSEKMVNIFASPGELFDNVRLTGPTPSNWFVPWIIFVVVALAMGQLLLTNPSLTSQLEATLRQSIEKSVQEGSMTQEQADQAAAFTRPGSAMFLIGQSASITFSSLIILFVLSLLYWLIGKSAMSATAPFMKVVEVVGLTFFIGSLEYVVTTMLMFLMDSVHATPSLALFVPDFDVIDKTHLALAKINAFTFWDLSVVSVGLSRLFQRDFPKVLVLVFALWVLWSVVSILTGIRFG